ncbi:MAG: hypothetical protein WAV05_08755 [Anaerolineales bacterium]
MNDPLVSLGQLARDVVVASRDLHFFFVVGIIAIIVVAVFL